MKFLLILFPILLAAQYRTIYPYSVVPGGIDAATVNAHITRYEDFYHMAVLRRGRYYLEYSQAGVVAWTHEQKELKQGTHVFVNNRGEIKRTRCGNGISSVPREPRIKFTLPPDKVLDTPQIVDVQQPGLILPHLPEISHLIPDLPIYESHPPVEPEFPEIQPFGPPPPARRTPAVWFPPMYPTGGIFIPIPPAVVATPEPAYGWILIGLMVAAISAMWWKKTSPKDKD